MENGFVGMDLCVCVCVCVCACVCVEVLFRCGRRRRCSIDHIESHSFTVLSYVWSCVDVDVDVCVHMCVDVYD